MIRSHSEYKRRLFLYVSALHSWGFRDSHIVDVSDYHGVVLEMLERTYFLVNTYDELLSWTRPRRPWLVVDNHEFRNSSPRGIAAPVKPQDLIELEKNIEKVFGIGFQDTASTAWHDPDTSVDEPTTKAWLESGRNRLSDHIASESKRLSELTDQHEVLVLPDKIEAYSGTETD